MALIKSGNCYGHFNPKPTKKGREGIVIVQMCAKRSPQQISLWLDSQKSGNWKKKLVHPKDKSIEVDTQNFPIKSKTREETFESPPKSFE